jgi:hypothetical protein
MIPLVAIFGIEVATDTAIIPSILISLKKIDNSVNVATSKQSFP